VFAWHDVAAGDRVEIGGLAVSFSRTDHPVETLAVRIDCEGRSMAYSADTGPGWSFAELGSGIDLALCEATLDLDHEDTTQHLSGRQAGAMAERAGVAHLVLTHFWPTHDPASIARDAQAMFSRRLSTAAIGKEFDV
jgi:ribonuclease BN (tRNA processing enzyme)